MTQARIEPAVADDESAQPTALPQPYAYDSEALRKKLADARDEGIKRLRRIQRPTIALGLLILLANVIVPYGVGRARQLAVNISITSFGAYILALAITPLQPRSISAITSLLGFLLFVAAGLQVRSVARSAVFLFYGCKAALNVKATCKYNLVLIIFRSIGATVDLFFCVLLFRGLCRRMSSFQRYEAIWKAFGMTFVLRGAIAIVAFSGLRLWLNDQSTSTAGSSEAGGIGLFITGVLAMNKRLRLWVHSRLASIGAEVSAAVSISTMFAAVGRNDDILARTQETLRAVSAADVRASAFLNVDPDGPNVNVPARLGQIDAFISYARAERDRRAMPQSPRGTCAVPPSRPRLSYGRVPLPSAGTAGQMTRTVVLTPSSSGALSLSGSTTGSRWSGSISTACLAKTRMRSRSRSQTFPSSSARAASLCCCAGQPCSAACGA